MDIVLGVSMTPKTVRMVLVEGEKGDGSIVDHDTFELSSSDGTATKNAADQVVAAVLGTQESAAEGGHELKSIGVTWSDRAEAAQLRDALAARGIRDVILVSELHAAGALAQAAGRAVGYTSTALLFIDRDSATLSVVHGEDGSIVKVLSTNLHSSDAMAVLGEMAAAVEAQDAPPQGMFVVGSGVDIAAVKAHLQNLVELPVSAPEESSLALARGAAIAAANAPIYDATTAGLAYSQDPDGFTAGNDYVDPAGAATMLRPADPVPAHDEYDDFADHHADEGRKPFLLVGSALTSIFVIGVVALVISLAVSIRPTADQRPEAVPAIIPAAPAEVVPSVPEAAVPAPAPAPKPAPAPAPETIKAPIPVVQQAPQAPPRQVYVEPPAAPAPAPLPAAPPVPLPVAPPPPPVYNPPVYNPPVIFPPSLFPPIWQPPRWEPPRQKPPWQQWPPRVDDDDWPQGPQWPQNPAPSYPQNPVPSYPQYPAPSIPQAPPSQPQYPQWPGQSSGGQQGSQGGRGDSDGGGRGGDGSGRGGYGGNGGGGGRNCFLIFCG